MPNELFLEAAADVLAIVRAMACGVRADEAAPLGRRGPRAQGSDSIAAAHEQGTPEHKRAMFQIEQAVGAAFSTMHNVEALAPVLGAAVGRLREMR